MSEINHLYPDRQLAEPKPSAALKPVCCKIGYGWKWLKEGFLNFTRNPGSWVIALLFLILFVGISTIFPLIGVPVVIVLLPIFIGGLMLGSHQLWQQRNFHSRYLFAGFETHRLLLFKLGVIQLLGVAIAGLLALMTAAAISIGHLEAIIFATSVDASLKVIEASPQLVTASIVGAAVFVVLMVVVAFGSWLSPALVVLGRLGAWQAFRVSAWACVKNIIPLLWLNLIVLMFAVLLFGPLILLAWVVPTFAFGGVLFAAVFLMLLLPAMVVSMYCMARDVFPDLQFEYIALALAPMEEKDDHEYSRFSN